MAQWKKLQELAHQNPNVFTRVSDILKRTFLTTEVRHELADWIEGQNWAEQKNNGRLVFQNLIALMAAKENDSSTEFVNKLKWGQEKQKFMDTFNDHPEQFVIGIDQCLQEERLLIQSCEAPDGGNNLKRKCSQKGEVAQPNYEIERKIVEITEKMKEAGSSIKELESKQEELFIAIPEIKAQLDDVTRQIDGPINGQAKDALQKRQEELQEELRSKVNTHYEHRKQIGTKHVVLATDICYLLKDIWGEISAWHKDQKLEIAALSKIKEGQMDILEEMSEKGAQLLIDITQKITAVLDIYMKRQYTNDPMVNVMQQTLKELKDDYLKEHLCKVTVVERNVPHQILKVTTGRSAQFSMSVRILGGKAMGLELNPPKVTARIYHENKLELMMREGVDMEESVCKIANSEGKLMEVNRNNGRCIASFNNMQLNNLRRFDRGNKEELVTEQKYGVVFFMDVQVRDKSYTVKALSLPVILTSQTSQECMAKGTLIWDAAFSKDERIPFQCADQVPWPKVADILNAQFLASTGRGLTEEQLNYLARIVFKAKKPFDYNAKQITDKELIRDKLLPREFSFWRWFWACLNLVKDLLKADWEAGSVHGFISKSEAEACLKDQPDGTFLLRFSEQSIEQSQKAGICGFLTVAVTTINPDTGHPKVFYVKQHLTPTDLRGKDGLLSILESFEIPDHLNPHIKKPLLVYLYPDTTNHFSSHFAEYGAKTGKEDQYDEYTQCKEKVEIYLTSQQRKSSRMPCSKAVPQTALSPTHSMDVPSPASFVSITNGSPPPSVSVTSPAQSDSSYHTDMGDFIQQDTDDLFTVERPVAHIDPMPAHGSGAKRAALTPLTPPSLSGEGGSVLTNMTTIPNSWNMDTSLPVVTQPVPQADITTQSFRNLDISDGNGFPGEDFPGNEFHEFLAANGADFTHEEEWNLQVTGNQE